MDVLLYTLILWVTHYLSVNTWKILVILLLHFFYQSSAAVGGSTELWRPLRTLNLLPPSHGVRNVLLISDGHVNNQPQTLQLVRDNVQHTRLFTCGLK